MGGSERERCVVKMSWMYCRHQCGGQEIITKTTTMNVCWTGEENFSKRQTSQRISQRQRHPLPRRRMTRKRYSLHYFYWDYPYTDRELLWERWGVKKRLQIQQGRLF